VDNITTKQRGGEYKYRLDRWPEEIVDSLPRVRFSAELPSASHEAHLMGKGTTPPHSQEVYKYLDIKGTKLAKQV